MTCEFALLNQLIIGKGVPYHLPLVAELKIQCQDYGLHDPELV
jgi:hypothetical protein